MAVLLQRLCDEWRVPPRSVLVAVRSTGPHIVSYRTTINPSGSSGDEPNALEGSFVSCNELLGSSASDPPTNR
jgi:hypothetical protein